MVCTFLVANFRFSRAGIHSAEIRVLRRDSGPIGAQPAITSPAGIARSDAQANIGAPLKQAPGIERNSAPRSFDPRGG